MTNVVYTPAKNGQPATIKLDEIKTTNDQGTFVLKNAEAEYSDTPEVLTVKHATYSDPDVGAVSVKTTPIGKNGSATITVSGSEGTVEFKTDDTSTYRFNATMDGKQIGALDCSNAQSL